MYGLAGARIGGSLSLPADEKNFGSRKGSAGASPSRLMKKGLVHEKDRREPLPPGVVWHVLGDVVLRDPNAMH